MNENKKLVALFKSSKKGNKDSQKLLLDHIMGVCHPLVLSFVSGCKKLGISYEDLKDLTVEVLFLLNDKVDPDSIYDFDNLVKFYYLKAVQNEIRYATRGTRGNYITSLSLDDPESNNEYVFAQNSENYNNGDLRNLVMQDAIYKETIVENKVKLTNKEKDILILFLNDVTIKEIAAKYNINYQTAYKHLKKGLTKVKNYLLEFYPDLYNKYI